MIIKICVFYSNCLFKHLVCGYDLFYSFQIEFNSTK